MWRDESNLSRHYLKRAGLERAVAPVWMLPKPSNIEKTNFELGLDEYKRPNIDNEKRTT
jgi:hypothetical protein